MEDENQVLEATSSDEEVVFEEETTDGEDVEALRVKLEAEAEAKRQITARAHKAEAELKALKAKQATAPQESNSNVLSADDVDIKILQSQGLDDESVSYLKKLARVNGSSILAAQTDPIYQAFKSQKEAKEKSEQAALGASRASSKTSKGKTFSTPGISEEEFKELWKKQQGL